MNPQQILFYTDAAAISAVDLTRLRKAGIVPIKVADPSAAKLVTANAALPIAPNAFLLEAMRAIDQCAGDATKKTLIAGLTRVLEDAAQNAKTPA